MKIACSSSTFAGAIARGERTQLEWLDACANELEVDGVVFAREHFPRTDAEYLAQLKKTAADLGLTIAAVADDGVWHDAASFDIASSLGAPLIVARPARATDDARAWPDFVEAATEATRRAKSANITIALRNAPATLCESTADLRRLAKDVDAAWLRYALDPTSLPPTDDPIPLLAKTVIAIHPITAPDTFATPTDLEAPGLIARLARLRCFITLETQLRTSVATYNEALLRFQCLRHETLNNANETPA